MTPAELADFYNRKKADMRRFAARYCGDNAADDAVQESFVRLLPHCDKIDGAAPAGYVFAALKTASIDAVRQRGRRRETLMDEVPEDEKPRRLPGGLLRGHLLVQACRVILQQAVARLSANQRGALKLWLATEGHMGQALTILRETEPDATPAVYAGRLHQAKERLREELRDYRELFDQLLPATTFRKLLNEIVCEFPGQPEGGGS
ncbi:MAG TPA: RNA polymerase sigma factor [Gemmataceae bacterium]|nr:RNA polymerase sigma factor [Gemmataceae bacterium]